MRALIATGGPDLIELRDVPEPVLEHDSILVEVVAVSINRGELHRLRDAEEGWRPGWDFAGTVIEDPSGGFAANTRVYGMKLEGAWAERVVAPSGFLAEIPTGLEYEQAAALPVAGLTALRILRLADQLERRSILIAGAAGGVGRFALQLARLAGAEVHARARTPARTRGLTELGAHRVWTDDEHLNRDFDVILDNVGGASLEAALEWVSPNGLVISYGNSAHQDTTLRVSDFYPRQATLKGYHLLHDVTDNAPASDLAHLADLAARGDLRIEDYRVGNWQRAGDVLAQLAERATTGKAVMRVADTKTTVPPGRR